MNSHGFFQQWARQWVGKWGSYRAFSREWVQQKKYLFKSPHGWLVLSILNFGLLSGLCTAFLLFTVMFWAVDQGLSIQSSLWIQYVSIFYCLKVIFSPVVDWVSLPFLPKRWGAYKKWACCCQLLMLVSLWWLHTLSPLCHWNGILLCCALFALAAAFQDIALEAWRVMLTPKSMSSTLSTCNVVGYRLGCWCGGGFIFIMAHQWGWTWAFYSLMIFIALGWLGILFTKDIHIKSMTGSPHDVEEHRSSSLPIFVQNHIQSPAQHFQKTFSDTLSVTSSAPNLSVVSAKEPGAPIKNFFSDYWQGLRHNMGFFSRNELFFIVGIILSYKVADAFSKPFLPYFLGEMGYSKLDMGLIDKSIGLIAIVVGTSMAGLFTLLTSIRRCWQLWAIFQMVCLGLFGLYGAHVGKTSPLLGWLIGFYRGLEGFGSALLILYFSALAKDVKTSVTVFYAALTSLGALGRLMAMPLSKQFFQETSPQQWPLFFMWAVIWVLPFLIILSRKKHRRI